MQNYAFVFQNQRRLSKNLNCLDVQYVKNYKILLDKEFSSPLEQDFLKHFGSQGLLDEEIISVMYLARSNWKLGENLVRFYFFFFEFARELV